MNLPTNPFARSFLIGVLWLVIVIVAALSRFPGQIADYPRPQIFLFILISVIMAAQLGVIARHFEKLRSWTGIFVGTMVGWFAIVGALLLSGNLQRPATPESQPGTTISYRSTDEMMAKLATEAVNWVKADRGITLDYSPDSIKIIDEELVRIQKLSASVQNQSGYRVMSLSYGAYIGEVLRRQHGGTWAETIEGQSGRYLLNIPKYQSIIKPVDWCQQRLTEATAVSVHQHYLTWAANYPDAPTHFRTPPPSPK
jgi:hypothetical protein